MICSGTGCGDVSGALFRYWLWGCERRFVPVLVVGDAERRFVPALAVGM